MKIQSLLFFLASLLLTGILSGCDDFLSETPRTSASDEQLFQTQEGFEQVLNGIYVNLGSRSLYGENLTMGYVSALAKNYNVSPISHRFYQTNNFNYEDPTYPGQIWNQAYRTIAPVNNLLANIDAQRAVFSGNSYALIKGEALAIRALLHFDLLRLFAPNYRTAPNATAIPYRTDYSLEVKAASRNAEVITLALEDLNAAEELLTQDPMLDNDLNRRFRLNIYAVLALKARIYDYIGDAEQAVNYARQVTESNRFPFVENAAISTANPGRKDRLFSSELVLALRVNDLTSWTYSGGSPYFRFSSNGAINYALTLSEGNYRDLFEGATYPSDYRYQYLFEVDATADNTGGIRYPSKYWQTWVSESGETSANRLDRTVPLIRVTEMYYILASHAPSIEEALVYLNTVRENRGITTALSATTINSESLLLNEITKEYVKEFYAEGETFFWYKQQNAPTMRLYPGVVTAENYTLPIPPTEVEYNPSF